MNTPGATLRSIWRAPADALNHHASLLLRRLERREEERCLYWWRPRTGDVNVGDYLSRIIVSAVLGLQDLELRRKRHKDHVLLAIGSILHNARDGDTIWGSGANGKISSRVYSFRSLDVRAVRGPLTRGFLAERGIEAPAVYGDPALLMSLFFSRRLLGATGARDFVVVPHFNEPPAKYADYRERLLLPTMKPFAFVRALLGAELVVSSSLHGLILAEAYGIPAVYLESGSGEHRFKYDDYYQGTGRCHWHYGTSVSKCLHLGGNAPFDLQAVQQGLLTAFPYDLW